jgi:hypothetical protein
MYLAFYLIAPLWLAFTSPCESTWEQAYVYDLDDCTSIERSGFTDPDAWGTSALCSGSDPDSL